MADHATALSEANRYFEENREVFVRDHHREYVLICCGQALGFFEDRGDAYRAGKDTGKTFIIRQCLREDEEQQSIFHSRVVA